MRLIKRPANKQEDVTELQQDESKAQSLPLKFILIKHSLSLLTAVGTCCAGYYYVPKVWAANGKSIDAWVEAFNAEIEADKRDPFFFWLQSDETRIAKRDK